MGTLEPASGLRAPRSSSPAYPRSWPGSSSSQKQADRASRRTLHTEETRAPWINETESTAPAARTLTDGSTKITALPYYSPDWNNISKADNEPEFQKPLLGKITAKAFTDDMAEEPNAANKECR